MLTLSKCLIIEVTSWNHIMSNYPFILYHTIVFHTDYNEKNWLVADPKVGSFHLFTFPGPPYSWMCGHTPTSLCVRKHMGCLIRCIMQWDSSANTKAIGLGLSTRTTQLSSLSSPSSWACYGTQPCPRAPLMEKQTWAYSQSLGTWAGESTKQTHVIPDPIWSGHRHKLKNQSCMNHEVTVLFGKSQANVSLRWKAHGFFMHLESHSACKSP